MKYTLRCQSMSAVTLADAVKINVQFSSPDGLSHLNLTLAAEANTFKLGESYEFTLTQ